MSMRKIFNLLLLFALSLGMAWNTAVAEPARVRSITPGSVGLAYLLKHDATSVTLKVEFDASFLTPSILNPDSPRDDFQVAESQGFPKTLRNFNIAADKDLLLFDERGIIAKIRNYKIVMRHWCENDGGVQYRPTARVTIPVAQLRRSRKTRARYDYFFAFAGIGKEADFRSLTEKSAGSGPEQGEDIDAPPKKLLSEGRMSDGRLVARLIERKSDAGCTSLRGEVDENLVLEHAVEAQGCESEWQCGWKCGRCCGP